jgi:hypothetical protein
MPTECYVISRKIPGGESYPIRVFLKQDDALAYKNALEKLTNYKYEFYTINKVDLI